MPRKVTLPCRSLSCSRSDLSCCVSLRLKQYHPTYLHESLLSIRENVYRYFLRSPSISLRFVSIMYHHHGILISINVYLRTMYIQRVSHVIILKIEFSVNNLKLIGYRIENRKKILTCWSVYFNKQFKREESTTRLSDCPSRDEKQKFCRYWVAIE